MASPAPGTRRVLVATCVTLALVVAVAVWLVVSRQPTPAADVAPAPVASPVTATPTATTPTPAAPTSVRSPTTTSPAPTDVSGVTREVVVNDPWSTRRARRYAITDRTLELIAATRRGDRLQVATYSVSDPDAVDALLAANRRGVSVQVLLGDHLYEALGQAQRLVRGLGTDRSRRSWAAVCADSCASSDRAWASWSGGDGTSYQHAKFITIDRAGDDRWVTAITSGNLTLSQSEDGVNDLFVTIGDRVLYDFLHDSFARLSSDPGTASATWGRITSGTTTLELLPVVVPEGAAMGRQWDPAWALLSDLSCHAPDGTGTGEVRVAMAMFSEPRVYLAERLRELAAQGCEVTVIGQAGSKNWDRAVVRALTRAGEGEVRLLTSWLGDGYYLHTKTIVVDAWDAAGNGLSLVRTGSENWLAKALYANDELLVTSTDPAVVAAYREVFDGLLSEHARRV